MISEPETLQLNDGTSVTISKIPGMSNLEWSDIKDYMFNNPGEARRVALFSKDAMAMRQWNQQNAFNEFYQWNIASNEEAVMEPIMGLKNNPEFSQVCEDVKRGGAAAAWQHSRNAPLMLKVNRAVGGIPEAIREEVAKIDSKPLTLQEACKMGSIDVVRDYLSRAASPDLDAKDAKGVSCLGYAVGANRIATVRLLLEQKADATQCDASGGTALHYAAAYGRMELLELFLIGGLSPNARTIQGQTPLALATRNKQAAAVELLKAKGGEM